MPTTNEYYSEKMYRALRAIKSERERQLKLKDEGRFSYTPSDPQISESSVLCMIMEEVGEAARNVLARKNLVSDGETLPNALYVELSQIAALCIAGMERLDCDAELSSVDRPPAAARNVSAHQLDVDDVSNLIVRIKILENRINTIDGNLPIQRIRKLEEITSNLSIQIDSEVIPDISNLIGRLKKVEEQFAHIQQILDTE